MPKYDVVKMLVFATMLLVVTALIAVPSLAICGMFVTIAITILGTIVVFIAIRIKTVKQNHNTVFQAILKYNRSPNRWAGGHINPFTCMEPYCKTFWRLRDWGCGNIVSREVWERIREYM